MFRKRSQPRSRVTEPVFYPAESAVEAEGKVYFITKSGSKLLLFSPRVVESWRFDILPGTVQSLSKHKKAAGFLGFRNGTLIENISDGKKYLISENKKRHIQSPDVFDRYGFDKNRIILVSQEESNLHEDGEVLK